MKYTFLRSTFVPSSLFPFLSLANVPKFVVLMLAETFIHCNYFILITHEIHVSKVDLRPFLSLSLSFSCQCAEIRSTDVGSSLALPARNVLLTTRPY